MMRQEIEGAKRMTKMMNDIVDNKLQTIYDYLSDEPTKQPPQQRQYQEAVQYYSDEDESEEDIPQSNPLEDAIFGRKSKY